MTVKAPSIPYSLKHRSNGVYGVPSMPMMKLLDGTVEHALAIRDALPNLIPGVAKKMLVRVPVRIVSFPHGFAYQGLVCHTILDDMKTSACLD